MTKIERYVSGAIAAGCPRDQLLNFSRAGLVFSDKQFRASAAARLCDHRCAACEADALAHRDPREDCPDCGPTMVGYGGARGGGKSYWALAQSFVDDCGRYGGLKFLYLRKVGKTGDEAVQDLRRSVLGGTPHHYHSTKKILTRLDNGSMVRLGHFQHENDIDQYLGIEYDGILIEEATQLTYSKVKNIGTSLRTSKPGWRPRMYLTTNPGGIGHAWFKDLFIKPLRGDVERATRFIQATVRDNRHVNPEYRRQLELLQGWQRAAWLEGEWDLAAGQFFTNFRRDRARRELAEIPTDWRLWGSFDYGLVHYSVFYLLGKDGDGNVWAIDEHAERGWVPADHAEAIHALLARHGLESKDLATTVAGGDVFNPQRDGRSIADDYESLGLVMTRADTDRVNGAAEIFRRLGNPESDPPREPSVFITRDCPGLLACLPNLQRDPGRGEDVLKVDCDEEGLGGDDHYDSFRYGVMYAWKKPARWGGDPFGEDKRW